MPAPNDPADETVEGRVLEGELVDGPVVPQASRPRQPVAVDAWASVAPKQTSRTMTLLALSPILVLPFLLLATRLPAPVRPVLVVIALVLTGYAFYRIRKPGRIAYRVTTAGIAVVTALGQEHRLPYDSLADLRIELTGESATALAFRPRGPYEAPGRSKDADGVVRIPVPSKDAARLDAAIRRAAATGYQGIVRR